MPRRATRLRRTRSGAPVTATCWSRPDRPCSTSTVRLRVHLLAQALRARPADGVAEMRRGRPIGAGRGRPARSAARPSSPSRSSTPGRELPDPRDVALDGARGDAADRVRRPGGARGDGAATRAACGRTRPGARTTSSSSGGSTVCASATRCSRSSQAATYLVVGLGDVYLGAPVAVPLDPRHRLVTTKYDPPRTWTPAERGRHRRRLPVRLRHGGTRRLPARRPHRAGLAAARRPPTSSRGCCGSSTCSASSR